ncbi:FAD-dependent oxidoreductase [Thermus filiformis]|uniref:FAD-dependent oxidoreductase n=1 Tax=Thermus filiformis TaxID=276 RepID=UPI0005322A20|nr:FAD-dependent oxidoreductase [Thermus filiformis]
MYEVLIVGAGFSGAEAAYRLARRGVRVGLMTQSLDSVMMPFLPPAPPFPEESLLEKAYDPQDPRVWAFHARAKYLLEAQENLHLFQATATGLLLEGERVVGVATWEGPPALAPRVALAVGSFLGARLLLGEVEEEAGRISEASYPDLFEALKTLGFRFVEREGVAERTPTTPGYRVRYHAFHPEEWEERTFRLPRLQGLYALGLCVREGDYRLMSQEGERFAQHLLGELGKGAGGGVLEAL